MGAGQEILGAALHGALRSAKRLAADAAVGASRPAAEHIAKSMTAAEGIDWEKILAEDRELWIRRGTVALLATLDYARLVAKETEPPKSKKSEKSEKHDPKPKTTP